MAEPIRKPAPLAVGDIIPGEPPVPITVWHVPAARVGETMSPALAERLVMNFTHGRRLVVDRSDGPQLARAANATHRRYHRYRVDDASCREQAALIVVGWPVPHVDADRVLAECASELMVGGCVAVVLRTGPLTVNQMLITAARAAGLTYLQHIVAAHDLTGRRGQLGDDGAHLRVHSDVLIFSGRQVGGTGG